MGRDIRLTASDSFQFGAYRADPAFAPKAAIVVIQEIFGVNHHIRAVCDRLANEGYVAIERMYGDRSPTTGLKNPTGVIPCRFAAGRNVSRRYAVVRCTWFPALFM